MHVSGCHVDPVCSPPGRKTQMVSLVTLYLVFRMRCRGSFCAHGWHLRSPHQKSIFCKRGEADYEWGLQPMFSSPLLGTSAFRARSTLFRPMCPFPGNSRACTQSAHWRTKDRMGSWAYNRLPWWYVLLANDVLCTAGTFWSQTRFWSSTPREWGAGGTQSPRVLFL